VKVYNSAGEVVAVLYDNLGLYSDPSQLSILKGSFNPDSGDLGALKLEGTSNVITWDGTSSAGQGVQSGTYSVVVTLKDSFGKTTSLSAPLTVIRTDSGVLVQVFNSAGELVWSESKASGSLGSPVLSERQLVPSSSSPGLKITYGGGASDYSYWSGLNSQGQAVESGTYLVQVTQNTPTGRKVFSESVTVLQTSSNVFAQAIAWPNPANSGASAITIWLAGLAPGSEAWGDVYDLAGERVGTLSPDPLGLRWDLPKDSASGIYLAHIYARDSMGNKRSQSIKIALTR
jgi:hypothetical protein